MNSPINYFGGKGTMFNNIIEHFPSPNSYSTYIEPFGGSYSIGLKMPYIPPNEVYNDMEENVYSFFKVLQDEELFKSFKRLADLTPYSEQLRLEYIHRLKESGPELDIVERAWMFFYVNKASRNGIGGLSINFAVRRNMAKSVSDYLSAIDRLPEFHERISHMLILHRDGISLIDKYGQDERVFMYCDPPCVWSTRTDTRYKIDMDNDLQQKFVDTCINAKCKLLISGYDNEIYKQLEDAGFQKIGFEVSVYGGNNISRTKTEYLWKNYDQQEISETSENISELF